MRLRFAAAVLAAFVVLAPSATPAAVPSCPSTERALAAARSQTPGLQVLRTLDGASAAALIEAYNAVPPVSHVEADRVVIVRAPTRPGYRYLLFAAEACLVGYGGLPTPILDSLMRRLGAET